MVSKKKFVELSTGNIVEVIDQFEDIAITGDRKKVKVSNLLNKNLYEEYIDPNSFFENQGLVSAFTEKIKQLPLDDNYKKEFESVRSDNNFNPAFSDPAILPYDPELEKREIIEKLELAKKQLRNNSNVTEEQLSKFAQYLDGEISTVRNSQFPIEDYSSNIQNETPTEYKNNSEKNQIIMDPIISMFKNVKRNTDFNISFSITNKIPRLDFIEMMEDSYNTSIIEFLAEEFTNEILENPESIKLRIIEEIKMMVYGQTGEESQETKSKTSTKTKTTKKNQEEND